LVMRGKFSFGLMPDIKAVILAGNLDFGRCPLASRLSPALWPISGKPALERLLRHLSRQEIKEAVICSHENTSQLQKFIGGIDTMQLEFLNEPMPVGTAGCIRDAANADSDTLFLLFHAAVASPPDVRTLLQEHLAGESDLTVVLEPCFQNGRAIGAAAEIYICSPRVLEYIPAQGYCDIKEGLIPVMLQSGRTIRSRLLRYPVGNFRDRAGYLAAIAAYFKNGGNINGDFNYTKWSDSEDVWLADGAEVDPSARICGPVIVMDGARVPEKAVIFGPSIIERNVNIGENTLIEDSVLWEGSQIGQNCEIRRCVIDSGETVSDNSITEDMAITSSRSGGFKSLAKKAVLFERLPFNIFSVMGICVLICVFLWSYWPELTKLKRIWLKTDEYSVGMLVPFLALHIIWTKARGIAECRIQPSIWGLCFFVAAQAMRGFGLYYMYASADRLSFILSIVSLTILLFGWQVFRKTAAVLLFLCLMLPLPHYVHTAVMLPLQKAAAASTVFCLDMIGYSAVNEANIITLNGTTVAVGEACNGLRMATAFLVVIGWIVLLVRREWWEKVILLLSGLPIALLCNTLRLTITAMIFTKLTGEKWERIFHDFGGYAMIPLALALVIFELWILRKLATASNGTTRLIRDIKNYSG